MIDLAFWMSIKDSDDPDDFQTYLETFPNGAFAGRARERISELQSGGNEVAALTSIGRFDGTWVGKGTLTSGETLCPYPQKIVVKIVGNELEGQGRRKWKTYKISAQIDAFGNLKGSVTGEMAHAAIVETYEDDRITGTAEQCQRRREYVPARRRKIAPRASAVACPGSPQEGPARGAKRPPRGWRRPARGRSLWAHGGKRGVIRTGVVGIGSA